jgi:hypothetical protein
MSKSGHQRRVSNVQGWSGYPPKLSVKADIPDAKSVPGGDLSRCSKFAAYSITSYAFEAHCQ